MTLVAGDVFESRPAKKIGRINLDIIFWVDIFNRLETNTYSIKYWIDRNCPF